MKKFKIPSFVKTIFFSGLSVLILKFFVEPLIESEHHWIKIFGVVLSLILGIFVIFKVAKIIEETTAVLKEKTGLAGGLLQSVGTAFPDMVIGVVAALMAMKAGGDAEKIQYAMIAASTTFGSNIYNVGHAAWCVFRQNVSNARDASVKMFPGLPFGGSLTPMKLHKNKLSLEEVDNSLDLLIGLTVLTFVVMTSMVTFGKTTAEGFSGDLYKLTPWVAIVILAMAFWVMYAFRKNNSAEHEDEGNEFAKSSMLTIVISLLLSGVCILFAAEVMVEAIKQFSELLHIPVYVSGVGAGLIGCLGEMVVVHNFSVHANGRLGDALIGVGMDNIVTVIGASIVALLGGIFLGGSALILIFGAVLFLNTLLIWQNAKLKNEWVQENCKLK